MRMPSMSSKTLRGLIRPCARQMIETAAFFRSRGYLGEKKTNCPVCFSKQAETETPVERAVIDGDHFDVLTGLRENGVNRFPKVSFAISTVNDNRNDFVIYQNIPYKLDMSIPRSISSQMIELFGDYANPFR